VSLRPLWTLSIRRWLYLSLAALFLIPVSTGVTVGALTSSNQGATLARELGENTDRWDDDAWLTDLHRQYQDVPLEFTLLRDGEAIYWSSQALDSLADNRPWVITQRETEVVGDGYVAQIYYEDIQYPAAVLAGVSTFILTLVAIAWFLSRMVASPLKATGEASRSIASGDLDVELPTSRVREVAEVNEAVARMSADLKQSLEQEERLEQDRRFQIGAIAHDLRTPLFSLRGYLEGIEQGIADTPEKRREYLRLAQQKTEALERMIADLSDFTRLEYLDEVPAEESIDVAGLLHRLADEITPRARAKGVTVLLTIGVEPQMCVGDKHLLGRAVENLLDNALRHTSPGGTVWVNSESRVDGIQFEISDSGPGIQPDELERIFDPLYRGEDSRNRRSGGSGLGLTIARRILRAHGGDLTADNIHTGGAIFTGELPARDKHREGP
jgi:signal transduction histidine kinase